MRFPLLFMLQCKFTMSRFRKTIDPRFPAELVDICALPLWVYINLKKKLGQKRAFEIMRVAILTGGIAQWNFAYRAAEEERTFDNLCDEEARSGRRVGTRWKWWSGRNGASRSRSRDAFIMNSPVGVPELMPAICRIDNRVVFTRGGPGHRIPDGAGACNYIWQRHD